MSDIRRTKVHGRNLMAAVAALALPAILVSGVALAQSKGKKDEITITITRIKALDRIDVGGGNPDFFARATIAGEAIKSPVVKQQTESKPDWKLTKVVPRGKTDIKLELLDKDVLNPDDLIDINRVDKKRLLEFTVDTSSCRVAGFSNGYRCGSKISRAGLEKKKAEIDFVVSVKKDK